MNNLCQFKRGFFTLRTCNRPAAQQCAQCQKLSCQYHLSAQANMQLCVDCAQKQSQGRISNYQDDDWVYSYRSWYYTSGYQPYRFGNQDYSSFENYEDNSEDWDDNYAGDFNDS